MLNIDRVFTRIQKVVPELQGKDVTDLRLLHFEQEFIMAGAVDFLTPAAQGPAPQQFAAGAIVVSIDADCFPEGQPANPFLVGRERFQIQMDYTQGDRLITVAGLASAIFGRNGQKTFPEKELYFPPQQNVFTTIRNLTPERLRVTVDYAALVWRFAQ